MGCVEGGWPPGVFMQGYDSMGVGGQDGAKDIILKELGSLWRKAVRALQEIGKARRGRKNGLNTADLVRECVLGV